MGDSALLQGSGGAGGLEKEAAARREECLPPSPSLRPAGNHPPQEVLPNEMDAFRTAPSLWPQGPHWSRTCFKLKCFSIRRSPTPPNVVMKISKSVTQLKKL